MRLGVSYERGTPVTDASHLTLVDFDKERRCSQVGLESHARGAEMAHGPHAISRLSALTRKDVARRSDLKATPKVLKWHTDHQSTVVRLTVSVRCCERFGVHKGGSFFGYLGYANTSRLSLLAGRI